ncbi:MAG: hypothetical protein JWM10_3686 [Myxococcaceae bacterium]|nr:hypothetical protein [Myxococcaceae bacterium]
MANKGIELTESQRRELAAQVARFGAKALCAAADVRSTQSLYRALSGASVLRMTAAALLAAGPRLAAAERPSDAKEST